MQKINIESKKRMTFCVLLLLLILVFVSFLVGAYGAPPKEYTATLVEVYNFGGLFASTKLTFENKESINIDPDHTYKLRPQAGEIYHVILKRNQVFIWQIKVLEKVQQP